MLELSPRVQDLKARLETFMDEHVYPNEERFYRETNECGPWGVQPVVEELKPVAKARGLWNLFLPHSELGAGLSNLEYAPLCEVMGRSHLAPEVFNCSAPDTGNMEVLARYGTPTLFPAGHGGLPWMVGQWVDKVFFAGTVSLVFGTRGDKVPLDFIEDQPRSATQQIIGSLRRPFSNVAVVEGQIEVILEERLRSNQSTFSGLARTH